MEGKITWLKEDLNFGLTALSYAIFSQPTGHTTLSRRWIEYRPTRTHVNSYPCQLVPMSTRTHVNSYPCTIVPAIDVSSYHKWCQLVPNKTSIRWWYELIYCHTIEVDSYSCQLVPMSTRTTNRCQLVPQVMSNRTQQGKYQMMVRVEIYCHTIYVNSYPCQLVPMSTRTTNRCQLVPQVMSNHTQQGEYQMMVRVEIYCHTIYVNSYPCQLVPMSTRTTNRCQIIPNKVSIR